MSNTNIFAKICLFSLLACAPMRAQDASHVSHNNTDVQNTETQKWRNTAKKAFAHGCAVAIPIAVAGAICYYAPDEALIIPITAIEDLY